MKSFFYIESTTQVAVTNTTPKSWLQLSVSGDPNRPARYLVCASWEVSVDSTNDSMFIAQVVLSQQKELNATTSGHLSPNTIELINRTLPMREAATIGFEPGAAFCVTDLVWGAATVSFKAHKVNAARTFNIRNVRLTAIRIPETLNNSSDMFWQRIRAPGQIKLDPYFGNQGSISVLNQHSVLAGGSLASHNTSDPLIPSDTRASLTYGRNQYGGHINADGGTYLVMACGVFQQPDQLSAITKSLTWNSSLAVFQPSFTDPANPYTPDNAGNVVFPFYEDRLMPMMPFFQGHTFQGEGGVTRWNWPDSTLSSHTSDYYLPVFHAGIVNLRPGQANVVFKSTIVNAGNWGNEQVGNFHVSAQDVNLILMPLDGYFDYSASTFAPCIIKNELGSPQDIDYLITESCEDPKNYSSTGVALDMVYAAGSDSTSNTNYGIKVKATVGGNTIVDSSQLNNTITAKTFMTEETFGFRAGLWSTDTLKVYVKGVNKASESLISGDEKGILVGGGFALRFFDRTTHIKEKLYVEKELDLKWQLGGFQPKTELGPLTTLKIETIVNDGLPAGTNSTVEIIDQAKDKVNVVIIDDIIGFQDIIKTTSPNVVLTSPIFNRTYYDSYPTSSLKNPWLVYPVG